MFWNKKEQKFRTLFEVTGKILALKIQGFPGYKDDAMETAKRLAFYEDLQELDAKLNLILSHLKLKYVPETETKEPAKLVDKPVAYTPLSNLGNGAIIRCPNGTGFSFTTSGLTGPTPTKPKKKGRPKKKPEFTGSEYKAVPGGFIITPPAKKRGRPKKK